LFADPEVRRPPRGFGSLSNRFHPRAYVTATVPSQMSPRMLKEVLRAMPHFPAKILRHFGR
jgi:hypothetical protein